MKNNSAQAQNYFVLFMVISVITTTELALDFYLPMLSQIRHELGASEALIEVTMSAYFLGVGISALIYGNLSDVWGRRRFFLTGIILFILGTLGCYLVTDNIYLLILYRFVQGCGSGVAWAIGNATMRDVFSGKEFAKAITLLHLISGMVPIIAPTIGGYIGQQLGWRTTFLVLLILAIPVFYLFYFHFNETNRHRQKFSWKKLTGDYSSLILSASYWQFATVKVLAVSVIFVELSNITMIFIETHGLNSAEAGYYVSAGCLAYVFGGFLNNYLLHHRTAEQLSMFGVFLIALGYLLLLATANITNLNPFLIQVIKIPSYIGFALLFSNATYCIINRFGEIAGSASALMITLEMLASSFAINLVSVFLDGSIRPVAYYALVCMFLSTVAYIVLRPQKLIQKEAG